VLRYADLAETVASWSEDDSTKVGCVLVGRNKEIMSLGYNGLPRGVKLTEDRLKRPVKYLYMEHAERNAIYNATLNGVCLKNSTMIVTHYPCADCARAIIQSGIKHCYYIHELSGEQWSEHYQATRKMFEEADVEFSVIYIKNLEK
jgi:dCMP deaminase